MGFARRPVLPGAKLYHQARAAMGRLEAGNSGTRRGGACSIALSSPLFDLPTVEIGGGNRVASDRATAGEARRRPVSAGVAGAMGC